MQPRFALRKTALLILAVSTVNCAAPRVLAFSEKSALPAPAAQPHDILPPELAETHAALYRAWQADDPAALRPYFARDAVITTSTGYYRGWDEIASRWLAPTLGKISGFFAKPSSFTHEDGDIVERGWYHTTISENGKTYPARGEYAQRWRRGSEGSWQVVSANVFAPGR
jgi:ketosteroid isomerase-like protein